MKSLLLPPKLPGRGSRNRRHLEKPSAPSCGVQKRFKIGLGRPQRFGERKEGGAGLVLIQGLGREKYPENCWEGKVNSCMDEQGQEFGMWLPGAPEGRMGEGALVSLG